MDCFDFQTVTAVIHATASLRHLRFAFSRVSSDQILSESLVLVIVRAVALMDLLISSVTPIHVLSSSFSLMGMVTGQALRILPMRMPCANLVNK